MRSAPRSLIIALLFSLQPIITANAHTCTASLCQLCCKAKQEGCVNAFTSYAKGTLISNNIACEQCNCDNPQIGCGWVGRRFHRVECTSCDIIETMLQSDPDLPISGCGRAVVEGALIFTS